MSDSYPPHLLRLPGSAPGSPARGRTEVACWPPVPVAVPPGGQQEASPLLLATPGSLGAYDPASSPPDRPRNVTELGERVTVPTPEPWPVGTYVLIGVSGRRAHWTGDHWKGGESPGYGGEVASIRSTPEQYEGAQP